MAGALRFAAQFGPARGERDRNHFLRASFLPDTHKTAAEGLLRRYIELRIPLYDRDTRPERLRSLEEQSSNLQHELWEHLVASGEESPPVTATFIGALHEMIFLDAARLHALRSHVPGAAWLLVLFVAGVGCYVSG